MVIIHVVLFLFLPFFLLHQQLLSLRTISLWYLVNILLIVYSVNQYLKKRYQLDWSLQGLQEKINLSRDENTHLHRQNSALVYRSERYRNLKKINEELHRHFDLEHIAQALVDVVFTQIGNAQGVCTLALVNPQEQKLSLYKTKKQDKSVVIKAKEGDIFDLWVLKHASPLLITDSRKDFRFDSDKLRELETREFSSLISAPLFSEHTFLGIIRLDNPGSNVYSQDDLRYLSTIADLGALALENSQLFARTQELAVHDSLTSLFTKDYFMERLILECKRSVRTKVQFSVVMLDVDHFKKYNDSFGHTAGDLVLRSIAETLRSCVSVHKKEIIISRFGGDEFCLLLASMDSRQAFGFAELLRDRVAVKKILLRREEITVTVSLGVASFPKDAHDAEVLLMKADQAMYMAKGKGRNRVCCL
ncbi:MAG: sensor domain-containing diguanylate cyclase [Candidatus Omnitrophica bacterium]|nr:sensor domain-containing diguanylate cyclase [Candidatus Omnitrophota bacterium]